MKKELELGLFGYQKWIADDPDWLEISKSVCTVDQLQKAFADTNNVKITSCELNASGSFIITKEMTKVLNAFEGTTYEGLPAYYDVRIDIRGKKHTEGLIVWLPVKWNERLMVTGGAGNRTDNGFGFDLPTSRIACPPLAIKNGFVGAITDGGVKIPMIIDWALDKDTNELDLELVENFSYASIHNLAVVVKKLIKAAYGKEPEYSYMQGASGGGRQAYVEAQKYPGDFDGIWSDCPAVNWSEFIVAELWPSVVMNEYKNLLSVEKLEAFRNTIIEKFGEETFYNSVEKLPVNAEDAIGIETSDGKITELDAKVMQMIWDGPRTKNGEFLWYGIRPGTESWTIPGASLLYSEQNESIPFHLPLIHIGQWLFKDPGWDWHTLTIDNFSEVFHQSIDAFSKIGLANDNADLSELQKSGHKLMITVGTNDGLIPPDGTIRLYDRIMEQTGSKEETKKFARLFLFPGTGHGMCDGYAPSFTMADGMIALMKWVEKGIEPEAVMGHQLDSETMEIVRKAEIYSY